MNIRKTYAAIKKTNAKGFELES